jgi:cytochrome bd-type quinol oxidase subunit 1
MNATALLLSRMQFTFTISGVAFGLSVVSGVVMTFQFGTNWSVLAKMSGPIQGRFSRTRQSRLLR